MIYRREKWANAKIGVTVLMAGCLLIARAAGAEELRSGVYALRTVPGADLDHRKVYIAVDKGQVTGYFDNPFTTPAENNPDRDPTCRFLFKGASAPDGKLQVTTFFAGKLGASLALSPGNVGVWSVHVDGDLPNCEVPTLESGDSLTLESTRNWIGFASIASARATLFVGPADGARTKAYLVRDDVVAVLQKEDKWVQVDYFQRGKDVVRWVSTRDLARQ